AKLQDALAAAASDPSYERNVAALQQVQPRWLGRDEVRIELGSPWVSTDDIEDFCREVFGASWVRVHHIAPLAAWEVEGNAHNISADAKITYTTTRKSAFDLLQAGLNSTSPTVYDEVYDSDARTTRRIRNKKKNSRLGILFSPTSLVINKYIQILLLCLLISISY
ncbi:hypothetical protein NOM78_18830, partial [Proteus mirabilis]|nr:hypothetical protein [Proteus mirabilis]